MQKEIRSSNGNLSAGRLTRGVVCAMAASLPLQASAEALDAGADQALTALSAVVKDRAQQVAAQGIAAQLQEQLCGKTLVLKGVVKTDEHGASQTQPLDLTLTLGGSAECRGNASDCTADDVFVDTCRSSKAGDSLQDSYYLRSLTRDTLRLLIRVAASALPRGTYQEAGLHYLADAIFDSMEALAHDGADITDLSRPLTDLADDLSGGYQDDVWRDIRVDPATKQAWTGVHDWLATRCASAPGDVYCSGSELGARWKEDLVANPSACSQLALDEGAFQSEFRSFTDAGGVVHDGRFEYADRTGCDGVPTAQRSACSAELVAFNVMTTLSKLVCRDHASESDFRNLVYASRETSRHKAILASDPTAASAYLKWADVVQTETRPGPERETAFARAELGAGIGVLAAATNAHATEPAEAKAWLDQLSRDLPMLTADIANGTSTFFSGPAMDLFTRPSTSATRELRDRVKTFIAIPLLLVHQGGTGYQEYQQLADAARGLLDAVARLEANERPMKAAADLLGGIRQGIQGVAGLATSSASAPVLKAFDTALDAAVRVLEDADREAWVAVALDLSDFILEQIQSNGRTGAVDTKGAKEKSGHNEDAVSDLFNTLRFVRVVLGAYEAESPEQARAIFESALEDAGSRSRRFERTSVDIAALAGPEGGFAVLDADGDGSFSSAVSPQYGFFAPVGLQVARGHLGVLASPIDLGAYLVADGDPEVHWQDALSPGLAVYARAGRNLPIAVGLSGTYHPPFTGQAEVRGNAFATIELPLFVIH